jgi:hypothetical protein
MVSHQSTYKCNSFTHTKRKPPWPEYGDTDVLEARRTVPRLSLLFSRSQFTCTLENQPIPFQLFKERNSLKQWKNISFFPSQITYFVSITKTSQFNAVLGSNSCLFCCFQACLKSGFEKELLTASLPSFICLHGTARLSSDVFSLYFIFEMSKFFDALRFQLKSYRSDRHSAWTPTCIYMSLFLPLLLKLSYLRGSAEAEETFDDMNMTIMFDHRSVASVCRNMIMCAVYDVQKRI